NRRAVASPIPMAAPVTMATLSFSACIYLLLPPAPPPVAAAERWPTDLNVAGRRAGRRRQNVPWPAAFVGSWELAFPAGWSARDASLAEAGAPLAGGA